MKLQKYMLLFSVLAATACQADVCTSKFGTLHCGAGTVDNINYMGYVDVEGTTVTNSCDILGGASFVNANLNKVNIRGETKFTKTTATGALEIIGKINANELTIKNTVNMTGNLQANHSRFDALVDVVGTVECDFCTFKSNTMVIGEMTTENSEFLSLLTINTRHSTFSSTKLTDLLVKHTHNNEEQVIYLKNGTQIKNITFESQKGVVIVSGNAKISGSVTGGKVVNE